MKTVLRLTLVAALLVACNTSFAQKFGYINMPDLYVLMPEKDSADVQLQEVGKELQTQLEEMGVELNKLADEYQKNEATYSEAIKEVKQQNLTDMQQRYQERQQSVQEQWSAAQSKYYQPIIDKAKAAVAKVSKAAGLTFVFNLADTEILAYYDAAAMTDVLPLVKKELNLPDKPKTAAATTTTPAATTTETATAPAEKATSGKSKK